MSRVLVVGSLNMDLVTGVNAVPQIGETVLGKDFYQIPGGKGANQAAAIGLLNGNIKMLGMVGNDSFGEMLINNLKKSNVDVSRIKVKNNKSSGIAIIIVTEKGDNSIIVNPGANFEFKSTDINEKELDDSDIIVAQLEIPIETIEYLFEKSNKMGKMTILNPAPARKLSVSLLKNIDLIIPNETELETLAEIKVENMDDVISGAKKLCQIGAKQVLVTLGNKGALYYKKNGEHILFSAYKVNAIDTTAAGDSFIGGLVVKLSEGVEIEEAIEFAMKVGALTVTKIGAQSSLPTLEEVKGFKGVKA